MEVNYTVRRLISKPPYDTRRLKWRNQSTDNERRNPIKNNFLTNQTNVVWQVGVDPREAEKYGSTLLTLKSYVVVKGLGQL